MSQLVPYAGYEPEETEYDEKYRRRTMVQALKMFRYGKLDTLEIAKRFSARESTIVRWLDSERNREYAEKRG